MWRSLIWFDVEQKVAGGGDGCLTTAVVCGALCRNGRHLGSRVALGVGDLFETGGSSRGGRGGVGGWKSQLGRGWSRRRNEGVLQFSISGGRDIVSRWFLHKGPGVNKTRRVF